MWNYLIRRLLLGLFTLWVVTFLVYGLIRSMPGDPLTVQMESMAPGREIRQEDRERTRKHYGLDSPWYIGYWPWLTNVLSGDLGMSIPRHSSVNSIVLPRIGPTLLISATSLFLAYVFAIPLGLLASARAGKLDERALSLILYMLYSLPSFVGALFLQMFFAVKLDGTAFELPLMGMRSANYDDLSSVGKTLDILRHAILPITCMTYGVLAYYSRFIRANMQEVMRQDYIRTARAKGVSRGRVIVHHAFRNTLIPLVTMIGLSLPALLSGAVILEQIFSWPGIGSLFFESILQRDYDLIMGLVLLFSVLTLLGQLLADLLYAVVDPRVSLS